MKNIVSHGKDQKPHGSSILIFTTEVYNRRGSVVSRVQNRKVNYTMDNLNSSLEASDRDKLNPTYTITNRFSNYLRSKSEKPDMKIIEAENDLANSYKSSKMLADKTTRQHRDNLKNKYRRAMPQGYQEIMGKDDRIPAGPVIVNALKEKANWADRSEILRGRNSSSVSGEFGSSLNRDDRRVANKLTNHLNEATKNETHLYSRLLEKKMGEKRIIVRDKKENQNKMFRELLEEARVKHFTLGNNTNQKGLSSKKSEGDKKGYNYIENRELKKMTDKIKVDMGLSRLRDQLLDDFVYLANKERTGTAQDPANSSVLSKDMSRALYLNGSNESRKVQKEPSSDAAKKLGEINEFMMERAVLNFKSVGRDPANEGLSYNLNLHKNLPHDYNCVPAIRWFEKGVATSGATDLLTSINAFKQAVIQDGQFFQAIYNLGCLYETVKDFELAFKWFYLAKNIEPEDVDVNFALALCYYKLKKYKQAIELLETYCLIENSTDQEGKDEPEKESNEEGSDDGNISSRAVQTYILCICYKGLMDFDKTEEIYNKFIALIDDSSNREVALYLFALLNKNNSSFSVRKMEEIKMGLLRSCKSLFPEKTESIKPYWDPIRGSWYANQINALLDHLVKLNFFKRFTKDILVLARLILARGS